MNKHLLWYQLLKHERMQRGWSQADLADNIGGDLKTIQRWERGHYQPQPHYRQRLIALFGKSADEWGWTEHIRK